MRVQNGYGFVHFAFSPDGIRAALTAVQCLHQVTIDRVTYDCSISYALQQYLIAVNDPTLVPSRTTHPGLSSTSSPQTGGAPFPGDMINTNNSYSSMPSAHNQYNRPTGIAGGMDFRCDPYLEGGRNISGQSPEFPPRDYFAMMRPPTNGPRGAPIDPYMHSSHHDPNMRDFGNVRMASFGRSGGNPYGAPPNSYGQPIQQAPSATGHQGGVRGYFNQPNHGEFYNQHGGQFASQLNTPGMGFASDRFGSTAPSNNHQSYGQQGYGPLGSRPGSATSHGSGVEGITSGGSGHSLSFGSRGGGVYSEFLIEEDVPLRTSSYGGSIPYPPNGSLNTARSHGSQSSEEGRQPPAPGSLPGDSLYANSTDSPKLRQPSNVFQPPMHHQLGVEEEMVLGFQRMGVDGANGTAGVYPGGYYNISAPVNPSYPFSGTTSKASSGSGSAYNLHTPSFHGMSSEAQGSFRQKAVDQFVPTLSMASMGIQSLSSASGSYRDLMTSGDVSDSENVVDVKRLTSADSFIDGNVQHLSSFTHFDEVIGDGPHADGHSM